MRKKYKDCVREDGDCSICSLVRDQVDCHGRHITNIEWSRRAAGLTQQRLADKANVGLRLVQKVEGGESQAGNLAARNLLAIADALGVDPQKLI